jgi:hypothetical protein
LNGVKNADVMKFLVSGGVSPLEKSKEGEK